MPAASKNSHSRGSHPSPTATSSADGTARRPWAPSAPLEALVARAKLLELTRDFFKEKHVLEVDTPLLCARSVTDPYIDSFAVEDAGLLMTSPEFAMKRLLAAGTGSIFQICKAFRRGESGARHNPEFTMLEWYRVGFDLDELMTEVDELVGLALGTERADRYDFGEVFETTLGCDPHTAETKQLADLAATRGIHIQGEPETREDWIRLLSSRCVEPVVGQLRPAFLVDFPSGLACLSQIDTRGHAPKARRFELYFRGVELANGYFELLNPDEHRRRFERDLESRRRMVKSEPLVDDALLDALESGVPPCSGVALGFDRLLMLQCGAERLQDILAFDWERA